MQKRPLQVAVSSLRQQSLVSKSLEEPLTDFFPPSGVVTLIQSWASTFNSPSWPIGLTRSRTHLQTVLTVPSGTSGARKSMHVRQSIYRSVAGEEPPVLQSPRLWRTQRLLQRAF